MTFAFLDLQNFGLTLVEDMPEDRESLRMLMHRVGCVRSTHYGDIFHVVTKPNANNLAYLPVTLGLHIDLPYYGYNPGVSRTLHCLEFFFPYIRQNIYDIMTTYIYVVD